MAPNTPSITPVSLLEKAARARRLAQGITDKVTVSRLTDYAEELEARAKAVEVAAHPQKFVQQSPPAGVDVAATANSGTIPTQRVDLRDHGESGLEEDMARRRRTVT